MKKRRKEKMPDLIMESICLISWFKFKVGAILSSGDLN